jgi:hypothetical protein
MEDPIYVGAVEGNWGGVIVRGDKGDLKLRKL